MNIKKTYDGVIESINKSLRRKYYLFSITLYFIVQIYTSLTSGFIIPSIMLCGIYICYFNFCLEFKKNGLCIMNSIIFYVNLIKH